MNDKELYELIDIYIGNTKLTKRHEYIQAVLNKTYRGYISSATFSRYNKKVISNKKNNSKPLNFILNELELKYCGHCNDILDINKFALNSSNVYGLQAYCKPCQYKTTKPTQPARSSNRRAKELKATPAWSNRDKIKEIYKNCPTGYHVDHEIPLQGKLVCGLHVEGNLQYLTAENNLKKSNKF